MLCLIKYDAASAASGHESRVPGPPPALLPYEAPHVRAVREQLDAEAVKLAMTVDA